MAWDLICTPKMADGTEIRQMRDVNTVYITKLGWYVCTRREKTWVQLIQSKYMRGRRVLDFQQTVKASSSIWPGIRRYYESLREGICVKVGRNSVANIWDNPRLHHLPNFMLPTEFNVNHQVVRIRDLMSEDGIN